MSKKKNDIKSRIALIYCFMNCPNSSLREDNELCEILLNLNNVKGDKIDMILK